jgi:hypothetical protein
VNELRGACKEPAHRLAQHGCCLLDRVNHADGWVKRRCRTFGKRNIAVGRHDHTISKRTADIDANTINLTLQIK